jgi:hypothetical protein
MKGERLRRPDADVRLPAAEARLAGAVDRPDAEGDLPARATVASAT